MYQTNSEAIRIRRSNRHRCARALMALAAVTAVVTSFASVAQADDVIIRWTHSDPDIAGFRVYTSLDPNSFTQPPQDITSAEFGIAENPEVGQYYFAAIHKLEEWGTVYVYVTAYDSNGVESLHSNQRGFEVLMPDSDGDSYGDEIDLFPNDPAEWADADSDGYGDNIDLFDDDPVEYADSDGDGYGDVAADQFPNDSTEWYDTDSDGVGDNADAFDDDPTETTDTDGDGVGDNGDLYPNDTSEWADTDGDGVGDNADKFPNDPTQSEFSITLSPYRVNVGGVDDYVDDQGRTWTTDSGYSNNVGHEGQTTTEQLIFGTSLHPVYQRSRTGPRDNGDPLVYKFPLSSGTYLVTLHFCETGKYELGKRIFNIELEGSQVEQRFDIFQEAGYFLYRAVVKEYRVEVSDEELEIALRYVTGPEGPMVMGIEVVSQEAFEGDVLTSPGKPFVVELQ